MLLSDFYVFLYRLNSLDFIHPILLHVVNFAFRRTLLRYVRLMA